MIYSAISKCHTFNNEFRADRIKDKGRRKPGETRERKTEEVDSGSLGLSMRWVQSSLRPW